MIDVNLLKQLGWSEELINEVTRSASVVNGSIVEQKGVSETIIRYGCESGDTIFFEAPAINSSINITLSNFKKL